MIRRRAISPSLGSALWVGWPLAALSVVTGCTGVLRRAGGCVYLDAEDAPFFNSLNARAERETVFTGHLFSNRWLWISFGAVVALQVAIVQLPFLHDVFSTTALTAGQWAICAAVAVSVLLVEEAVKLATRLTGRAPLGGRG